MKNPWTKKNPLLSMWLSGANAVAGSLRSRAIAEGKRQTNTLINHSIKQVADLYSVYPAAVKPRPAKKKRKARSSHPIKG